MARKTSTIFLPPVDIDMQAKSLSELVAHGEQGEKQSIQAGLELLRRKRNAQLRKQAA